MTVTLHQVLAAARREGWEHTVHKWEGTSYREHIWQKGKVEVSWEPADQCLSLNMGSGIVLAATLNTPDLNAPDLLGKVLTLLAAYGITMPEPAIVEAVLATLNLALAKTAEAPEQPAARRNPLTPPATQLYPTKTRLRLLRDVDDGHVRVPMDGVAAHVDGSNVSARITEMARAGWVTLPYAGADIYALTHEGRQILRTHGGGQR